jgi:hypothetical protein
MTSKLDSLRALRDAVKAGEEGYVIESLARKCPNLVYEIGCRNAAYDVWRASLGSLDAAHALHKAVLPGWAWTIQDNGEQTLWPPNGLSDEPWCADGVTVSVDSMDPSRAWLLAVLSALIAQEEAA